MTDFSYFSFRMYSFIALAEASTSYLSHSVDIWWLAMNSDLPNHLTKNPPYPRDP